MDPRSRCGHLSTGREGQGPHERVTRKQERTAAGAARCRPSPMEENEGGVGPFLSFPKSAQLKMNVAVHD